MKKMIILLSLLFVMGIVTACGQAQQIKIGEKKVSDIAIDEKEPSSLPLDTEQEEEKPREREPDEYVLAYPITVPNNRALTLRIFGKMVSEETKKYGVSEIEVVEGEMVIQRLMVSDAIRADAEWAEELYGGYTQSYSQDGGIMLEDMNFDGTTDIGLIAWTENLPNTPYYFWLWNEINQQFEYSFLLTNPKVDLANQYVITQTMLACLEHETDYYQYDEAGKLIRFRQIKQFEEEGKLKEDVYELRDGFLQKIE